MDSPRFPPCLLLAFLLPVLAGCGAGIVGVVAGGSSGGGSSSSSRAPALSLTDPTAPLVVEGNVGRLVIVNSLQISATAVIRLELSALGQTDAQLNPVLATVDPVANNSTIGFTENHANIMTAIADPTAGDVVASLRLLVDGRQVALAAPFTLIRSRVATLEPAPTGGEPSTLSALGNSLLRVRVTGRANEKKLEGVRLEIGVQGRGILPATGVQVKRITGSVDWEVSGFTPPSVQPGLAFPRVADDLAGVSSVVPDVFYRPAIQAISPAFGSTDGGTLVALFGQGLAPLTLASNLNSPPDFSRVLIEVERGGRRLRVPSAQLRQAQSSINQLVFTVPPTPDGRPGPAQVSVTISLKAVKVSDAVPDLFAYRRPAPGFGPRGALLAGAPVDLHPGTLQGGPHEGPDFVLLTSTGGQPRTEVLVSEQNGMFSSFGPPLVSSQQSNPGQSNPIHIGNGDFDGDGDTDVVVINKGSGAGATHSWLERAAEPAPLLSLSPVAIADAAGGDTVRVVGDFDGDLATDLVLLPTGASRDGPRIVLSRPVAGVPSFTVIPLGGLLLANGPFDVATAADLDGDGLLDLIGFTGGNTMRVITAYGDGAGSFEQKLIDLAVTGYTPNPASLGVGVHAVEQGQDRPIALVLGGVELSPVTPPAVAVLRPVPGRRQYEQPLDSEVVRFQGSKPIVASAFGDLVFGPISELVIAGADGSVPELRLLAWPGEGPYGELPGAFQAGLEPLEAIRSVSIGLAVPADGERIKTPIHGVFVDHRRNRANGPEDRISTWLVAAGPSLAPPDASVPVGVPAEGLALGNFSNQVVDVTDPDREARDCCVATPSGFLLYANGGVGDFAGMARPFLQAGVVPATLTAIDMAGGRANAVAFFVNDGRLGFLDPDGPSPLLSQGDLRTYASNPSFVVSSTSRVLSDDVDGDGYTDLVVVLVLEASNMGPYETVIVMLRGKDAPAPGEFPFHLPDGSTPAPSVLFEGTSAALGDFVMGSVVAPELAVAFPRGPNHVRFYRYEPGTVSPTDDRFVWSIAEPGIEGLIAGDEPAQLIAADLDGNQTVDLIVASGGDSKVRVFLNTGVPEFSAPGEVNIGAFLESQSTPALPPGEPTAMLAGDVDGDDVSDVVIVTMEETPQKEMNQHFSVYLSSGTGTLQSLRILLPFRTGNEISVSGLPALRDADVHPAFADVNYDGQPDLVLGWATAGANDKNLRVLFAGAR